jgi:hypothetical protein
MLCIREVNISFEFFNEESLMIVFLEDWAYIAS